MTSFVIYGLNGHELMPMEKVFKKSVVEKVQRTAAERPVDDAEHSDLSGQHGRNHSAEQAYRIVERLPESASSLLLAEQIMTSPVVTLEYTATISEALMRFQKNTFRHIPVISSTGRLIGIISDRDILRYLSGLTEGRAQQVPHTKNIWVQHIMAPEVLTASADTDVRYIARLFVEHRIGAMPIVKDGALNGIITRSDVLSAVMRHYTLELWA